VKMQRNAWSNWLKLGVKPKARLPASQGKQPARQKRKLPRTRLGGPYHFLVNHIPKRVAQKGKTGTERVYTAVSLW